MAAMMLTLPVSR